MKLIVLRHNDVGFIGIDVMRYRLFGFDIAESGMLEKCLRKA